MEHKDQPEILSQPTDEERLLLDSETQESIEMEDETLVIDEQTSQKLQEHLDYHQEMVKILSDVIHNKQLPKLPATRLKLLLGLKESKTKKMSGDISAGFLSKLRRVGRLIKYEKFKILGLAFSEVVRYLPEIEEMIGNNPVIKEFWTKL
ncbi:uncharacterized protein LOC141914503 [Tubulanus polymorphus]|uniref:uncharacterized protein LOC141914503 n=1 Tax=Tubulanus polymorphus TaxID=672921 RepID=UPI003DA5DFAF